MSTSLAQHSSSDFDFLATRDTMHVAASMALEPFAVSFNTPPLDHDNPEYRRSARANESLQEKEEEEEEEDEPCLEIDLNAIDTMPLASAPPISFQSHVLRKIASTSAVDLRAPSPAHSSPGPTGRGFNTREKDQLTSLVVAAITKTNAVTSLISPHYSSKSILPSSSNCLSGDIADNTANSDTLTSLLIEALQFKSLWNVFPMKKRPKLHNLHLLSEFGNLKSLELGDHVVQTLDGLEHFRQLECLLLPRNHLRSMDSLCSSSLNIRSSLRVLDLSGNFIGHIPKQFACLEALEKLILSGNNLSILKEVDHLTGMANLFECSLSGNPFCKLPTYRAYVISKLRCLEKLDDSIITSQIRSQSQRRFDLGKTTTESLEKKHQANQEKLQQAQLELEEENTRLKNELQLKSKLLQNKNVEWSTATQKLLQLQQEIDMLRIEETISPLDANGEDRQRSKTKKSHGSSSYSPYKAVDKVQPDHNVKALTTGEILNGQPSHQSTPEQTGSVRPRSGLDNVRRAFARLSPHNEIDWSEQEECTEEKNSSPTFSSCYENVGASQSASPSTSCSASPLRSSPSPPPHLSPRFFREDKQAIQNKPPSPLQKLFLRGHGELVHEEKSRSRVIAKTVINSPRARSPSPRASPHGSVGKSRQAPPDASKPPNKSQIHQHTALGSPETKEIQKPDVVSHDTATTQKQTGLQTEQQLPESANFTPSEALHMRKQALLLEIAQEEKMLHELTQQSTATQHEINVLTSTVHDQMLQLASLSPKSHHTRKAEPAEAWQRERQEELVARMNHEELHKRKRLEMLESELSFAQIKEKQIEQTIVHTTEGILDPQYQQRDQWGKAPSTMSFEKEIFGLTHKLQSVITRREELSLEIARLKGELQHATSDGSFMPSSPSTPSVSSRDAQEIQIKTKADVKRLDMLKRRLGDLEDRVKAKEQLLSMMVQEIRDIDAQLEQMNEIGVIRDGELADTGVGAALPPMPATPPPAQSPSSPELSPERRDASPHEESEPSADARDQAPNISSPISESHDEAGDHVQDEEKAQEQTPQIDLKQLLTEDMLTQIKKDVCDKLLAQFVDGPESFWHKPHAAAQTINDIVEAQLHQLRVSPPQDESVQQEVEVELQQNEAEQEQEEHEQEFKEFNVKDAQYAMKYRFVRAENAETSTKVVNPSSSKALKVSHQELEAATSRIQKAFERLQSLQEETLVDSVTGIEKDSHSHLKSSLKVFVMAARDLETNHLRTKNLDPYVTLEVLPPKKQENDSCFGQTHRSKTKKRTVYPIWQEEFEFAPVTSLGNLLRIRVVNDHKQNASTPQIIGESIVPLSSLLHQKRVTDWFPLVLPKERTNQSSGKPSSVADRLGPQSRQTRNRMVHRSSPRSQNTKDRNGDAGAIRLQLQLQFSRVEKLKRTIDELVDKFSATYNVLPRCIAFEEPKIGTEIEDLPATVTTATSANDGNEPSDLRHENQVEAEILLQEQQPREVAARGSTEENNSPELPLQSLTESDSQNQLSRTLDDTRELRLEDLKTSWVNSTATNNQRSVEKSKPHLTIETNLGNATGGKPRQISVTLVHEKLDSDVDVNTTAFAALSTLHSAWSNQTHSEKHDRKPERKSPSPLAEFYQRKPALSPTANFFRSTPDCFDEDSIYHPFHLQLQTHAGMTRHEMDRRRQRRTDLRIFRSPNFARREPTQPFPERFIGLDTQTSERHKRFIQRMNSLCK